MKTLNASGCTNLVSLDCSSCGLESINLDGCTSLNTLNIRDNALLMFDAENLANLQELICDTQIVYMESSGKIFSFREYFSASSFVSSAAGVENVKNLKAFDASGNETAAELDSVTGIASFGEEPSKIMYDYDTCFNSVMMDVTVYFTDSSTEDGTGDSVRVSSSSGGSCNSAFGLLTLSAGVILILLKRR